MTYQEKNLFLEPLLTKPISEIPPNPPEGVKKLVCVLFPSFLAEAGIQYFQDVKNFLDPGFHRGDDLKAIFTQLPFPKGERVIPFIQPRGKALLPLKREGGGIFRGRVLSTGKALFKTLNSHYSHNRHGERSSLRNRPQPWTNGFSPKAES